MCAYPAGHAGTFLAAHSTEKCYKCVDVRVYVYVHVCLYVCVHTLLATLAPFWQHAARRNATSV